MKRGRPLARRKPLEGRSAPLSASGGPKRSGRPRPKPKPPVAPEVRARQEAWHRAVAKGKRCVQCGRPRPQGHHAPRRQVIERLGGDPWDPRAGFPLCEPCHEPHTNASQRVPRALVPAHCWEFARELGGEAVASLEREYPT